MTMSKMFFPAVLICSVSSFANQSESHAYSIRSYKTVFSELAEAKFLISFLTKASTANPSKLKEIGREIDSVLADMVAASISEDNFQETHLTAPRADEPDKIILKTIQLIDSARRNLEHLRQIGEGDARDLAADEWQPRVCSRLNVTVQRLRNLSIVLKRHVPKSADYNTKSHDAEHTEPPNP